MTNGTPVGWVHTHPSNDNPFGRGDYIQTISDGIAYGRNQTGYAALLNGQIWAWDSDSQRGRDPRDFEEFEKQRRRVR